MEEEEEKDEKEEERDGDLTAVRAKSRTLKNRRQTKGYTAGGGDGKGIA